MRYEEGVGLCFCVEGGRVGDSMRGVNFYQLGCCAMGLVGVDEVGKINHDTIYAIMMLFGVWRIARGDTTDLVWQRRRNGC